MTATISSVVAIGRRMNGADIGVSRDFGAEDVCALGAPLLRRSAVDLDAAAILEPVMPLGDDLLAYRQPASDHGASAEYLADGDRSRNAAVMSGLVTPRRNRPSRLVPDGDGVRRDRPAPDIHSDRAVDEIARPQF